MACISRSRRWWIRGASEARDGVKKTGEQPFKALPQFCFVPFMLHSYSKNGTPKRVETKMRYRTLMGRKGIGRAVFLLGMDDNIRKKISSAVKDRTFTVWIICS